MRKRVRMEKDVARGHFIDIFPCKTNFIIQYTLGGISDASQLP